MSSSSNGSTKQFLDEPSLAASPGYPRLVPPDIRLYPTLMPPPEASRYDQNFMLGYGGGLKYPRYPREPEKTGKSQESRLMTRPKAYDRTLLDPRLFLYPPTPELPRQFRHEDEDAGESWGRAKGSWGSGKGSYASKKTGGSYEWHIPRASLSCAHNGYGEGLCEDCVWKQQQQQQEEDHSIHSYTNPHHPHHHHLDLPPINGSKVHPHNADGASICSSINPPPTFTALDNYRPVRPPRPSPCRHCSCGIIFAITTIFSLLVLVLIAAFIIYVEMVLKHQTEKVMHKM